MKPCFLDLNCVRTSVRRLAQLLTICSVFVPPLAACSNMKTISWREEVRLHTGQVIMVDRTENYRPVSVDFRSGWMFDTETIKAHFPSPVGEITWSGILTPIAIDATSTGQVYLVADIANSAGAGYPRPGGIPQVAFRYLGQDQWQRIAISEIPGGFHRNLRKRSANHVLTKATQGAFGMRCQGSRASKSSAVCAAGSAPNSLTR